MTKEHKINKANIKNNPQNHDIYMRAVFTPQGEKVLTDYLMKLIEEYGTRTEYPYVLSPLLMVPMYHYSMDIKTKSEHLGRIKLLTQLLNRPNLELSQDEINGAD